MTSEPTPMMQSVRVLDLSQFIPGPYCTMLLSDLGADVVKVEPPRGDPQKVDGPLDDDGVSLWYRIINRNKRIVSLDLKTPEGLAVLDKLIGVADVLLESFRPGVLARLGYGAERLAKLNDRLIHCALSGWGQTGPYRLRVGHDNNYQASVGVLDISGTAAQPITANPPIADFAGALNSFGLIAAALYRRECTGQGAFIDVAMSDVALSFMGPDVASLAQPDFDTRRGKGPYAGGWACYNTYRCACGGHVTIGALEPRFWANFCKVVGHPEWIARQNDPRPQLDLIGEVASLVATRNRSDWIATLGNVESCFHEVLELGELATNEQVTARQVLIPGDDGIPDVLLPAWLDGSRPPARRPYTPVTAEGVAADWVPAAQGSANSNERH